MVKLPSNSSAMQLRLYYASAALCAILLRSVGSCCELATTNASAATVLFRHSQHWRFCHASPTLRSWRSGQLNAWFKCFPKVGVAILDSRTTSERFHAHVIEELRAIFHLVIVRLSADDNGQTQNRVAFCLRLAWT